MKPYILLIIVALFCNSCGKIIKKEKVEAKIPVRIMEITEEGESTKSSYIGTIEEQSSTILSFAVGGTVESVYVSEGQRVSQGTVIAKLNDETSRHAYEVSQSTLEKAEDGYKRAEQVYNNGSLTEIKWVEIETQVAQARSMFEIAKKNLDDCVMHAPKSGIIGKRDIEPGMNILPHLPALTLYDISKVKAVVNIPENEISKITLGQEVEISVSALDNAIFKGKITEKGICADLLSHSYTIKIELPNSQQQLLPGMVCKARIKNHDIISGFQVPVKAVQLSNDNKYYVWVISNNLATRRYVEIGDILNNSVIITYGLSENDKLIIEGYNKLSEGTQVTIQ